MKVYVATFGTPEWRPSIELLRHSALHDGGADGVIVFTPEDVLPLFKDIAPELLEGGGIDRGYGYYSWKPHVIAAALHLADEGDVVVWIDAGATVSSPLAPYAAAVDDVLLFRLGQSHTKDHRNRAWCRRRCAELLVPSNTFDAVMDAAQVNAAVQVYKKCEASVAFVEEYASLCRRAELVADPPTEESQDSAFQAHRHDQAILSLMAAVAKIPVAKDPTQYGVNDPPLLDTLDDLPPLLDHHRRKFKPLVKVAVVTATVGGPHLRECLASVQAQSLPGVEHWVVVDGPAHAEEVVKAVEELRFKKPIVVMGLPRPTGLGGWNGHRVYAAAPWVVEGAHYVAWLDEDNAFEPDHLLDLLRACEAPNPKLDWAYSLRTIVDQQGQPVCPDNCESLGDLCHTAMATSDRLIDTSCYLLRTDVARETCPAWNARARDPGGKTEVDRALAQRLLGDTHLRHVAVRKHSVRYRAGSSPTSVAAEFFLRGNDAMGYDFSDAKRDIYLFLLRPEATRSFLASRRKCDRSYALDEWQQSLCRGLHGYNLLDGYANAAHLPHGATLLVVLWHPSTVPTALLASRKDLVRICYTIESPNIRHTEQWKREWLAHHFSVLLTYWKPLLDAPPPGVRAVYCPHNTHHLDLEYQPDVAQLRLNRGVPATRAVVFVGERRDLAGEYAIDGVRLRCQDPLREAYVVGLKDVTVHGQGWEKYADHPSVKVAGTRHRSKDPRSSVDIMADFPFALCIENTDAVGYCSEKLYDALMAGCIPLYRGSIPEHVPRDLVIDLTNVPDGAALQATLDALTNEDVQKWLDRVAAARRSILEAVGVKAFAAAVDAAVAGHE